MASRRAAAAALGLSLRSAAPAVARAACPLRCATPANPLRVAAASASAVLRQVPGQARWHSADHGSKSKVYDFEGIKALIEAPTQEAQLIDVREPAEYEAGFIPTAINIPIASQPDALLLSPEEFEDRFGFAKPPPKKQVVFYCKAGVRSSAAAQLALQGGFENVGEYRGSWMDWEKRGGEASKEPRGGVEGGDPTT